MQTLQGKDDSEIHLYQEIGINWHRIEKSNNWKSRIQNLKGRMKHQLAHNIHQEGDNPVQYGGVLISTNNKTVNWITDQGKDPSGLGRWVWQRFSKQDHGATTIISSYIPAKSTGGKETVWEQHETLNVNTILNPKKNN